MNFKSLGRYVLLINNKPFEAVLPQVDGMVNYAIDADLEKKERWYTVNGKRIPEVNVLWFVKDMTSEIASCLGTREQILLLKNYYSGVKNVTSIIKNHGHDMEKAKNDYYDAVNNILSENPDFNNSRKASLRLAEKIIKLKLKSDEREYEGCKKLADFAEKLDGRNIDVLEEIISEAEELSKECDDDHSVTCEEAVNTLNNSLQLYSKLFHTPKKPRIKIRN